MVQKDLIFKLEGNLKKYLRQKTKYSMKKLKERLEVLFSLLVINKKKLQLLRKQKDCLLSKYF